jgi:hypothetical protein
MLVAKQCRSDSNVPEKAEPIGVKAPLPASSGRLFGDVDREGAVPIGLDI